MIKFSQLSGRARRKHLAFVRCIAKRSANYRSTSVNSESEFRIAERLHRAGLITAQPSKSNWMGRGSRPFRELELSLTGHENPQLPTLPRRGR